MEYISILILEYILLYTVLYCYIVMNQSEIETMKRLRNNKSETKTLKISVNPQMYFEVEEYRKEHNLKSFEEAMFALF